MSLSRQHSKTQQQDQELAQAQLSEHEATSHGNAAALEDLLNDAFQALAARHGEGSGNAEAWGDRTLTWTG